VQATTTAVDELDRLQRVASDRKGLWQALLLEVLGLFIFVLIFNLIGPALGQNLGTAGLITLGLIFSLAPALLWLLFFYRLDRAEPEPKQMVLGVFMIGALLFAALYRPVLQGIFGIDEWLYDTWWARLLGGILVVGIFEQSLVYLSVRVSVFNHPEFDERVDGVIYGVAASLGIATVLNFMYVVDHGGVDLDVGSIRMVINTLAYAGFGGVLGYFIGQARFEKTPGYYLPLGLGIAALLNGVLFFLLENGGTSLGQGKPWGELILAAIVSLLMLAAVFWLVQRANEETLRLFEEKAKAEAEVMADERAEADERARMEQDAS
jgi:RsiW-degrading membrane proteinase PrsW (M82 family)